MSDGSFRKSGTESKGISGTAGDWAKREVGVARHRVSTRAKRFTAISFIDCRSIHCTHESIVTNFIAVSRLYFCRSRSVASTVGRRGGPGPACPPLGGAVVEGGLFSV